MTRYAIEIEIKGGEWKLWGGETFEFKSVAELKAISLEDNFLARTRVVPIASKEASS